MTYDQLIREFGSVAKLAATLNMTRQGVYQWNGVVPVQRAYQLEVVTKGRIKADEVIRGRKKKKK